MKGKLKGVFLVLDDIDKFSEVFIDEDGNIAWDIDKNIDTNVVWNNRIDMASLEELEIEVGKLKERNRKVEQNK